MESTPDAEAWDIGELKESEAWEAEMAAHLDDNSCLADTDLETLHDGLRKVNNASNLRIHKWIKSLFLSAVYCQLWFILQILLYHQQRSIANSL